MNQISRSACGKPVAADVAGGKATHQTEGIEDIRTVAAEMIAIIVFGQLLLHSFKSQSVGCCQLLNVLFQSRGEFFLGNAADGSELWVHADIGQIVDGTEDAEL